MDLQYFLKYAAGFLLLPLTVKTLASAWKQRKNVFDDDLTVADRHVLKQLALFVMLPVAVLLHELGHVLACSYLSVPVHGFHWALFWGEVPHAPTTGMVTLIIAASGNIVQIALALLALVSFALTRKPALAALSAYTYLWVAASALLLYPLVSLVAWRWDYAIIYGNADSRSVWLIAAVHLASVWFLIYSFLSSRARLLFVKKTRPAWALEFAKIRQRAEETGTAVDYLALAWQYYLVGLDSLSEKTLQSVHAIEPGNLDVWLLRGYIMQSQSKFETADFCFEHIIKGDSDRTLKARALMAKGHCLYEKILQEKKKDMTQVLNSYKQAVEAARELADPHYYLAMALKEEGRAGECEAELQICQNSQKSNLTWLDPVLANHARNELIALRSTFNKGKPGG